MPKTMLLHLRFIPLVGALITALAVSSAIAQKPATPKAVPAAKAAVKPAQTAAVPEKVTSVEGITEYRLPNGMKVLLYPDQSKPTVTVNITYLVGSKHENYGETGMAHLLEHLMFKGTPTQ
jgi:zinc protease